MPPREIAVYRLPLNGDTVLTPPLGGAAAGPAEIVVEGAFHFGYAGTRFDALYRTAPDGSYSQPHAYLRWSPQAPELVSQDVGRHRYVFRIPPELAQTGQSLGLRLDVDRLVREHLITPSEVRQSLSGEVRVRVLQAVAPPPPLGLLVGGAVVPVLLAAGGVGFIVRRRMQFQGLDPDLRAQVERIEQRYQGAARAARASADRLLPLQQRLQDLRKSAMGLAREAQQLRASRRHLDRAGLEREIVRMQEQLSTVQDSDARRDGEAAVAERQKSLVLLADLETVETRCLMRLAKIEAVLDSAALSLRGSQGRAVAATSARDDEALCRHLDAEVTAIQEVQRELVRCTRA